MNSIKTTLIIIVFGSSHFSNAQDQTMPLNKSEGSGISAPIDPKGICLEFKKAPNRANYGNFVEDLLPQLFQLSYFSSRYKSFRIVKEGEGCVGKLFSLETSVIEFSNGIEIEINASHKNGQMEKSFRIPYDSLLSGLERISRSLVLALQKEVSPEAEEISVLYTHSEINGKLSQFISLINNTFIYLIESKSLVIEKSKKKSKADIIINTSFKPLLKDPDRYRMEISLIDSKTNETLCTATRQFKYDNVLSQITSAFKELDVFLLDFKNINKLIKKYPNPSLILTYVDSLDRVDGSIAIPLIRRAIYLDSSYVPAYYKLGSLYLESREYGKAATLLKKVIKLNSGNPNGYYLLGKSLSLSGDYDNATQTLKKGKTLLKPGEKDLLVKLSLELSWLYEKKRQYDPAIDELMNAHRTGILDQQIWWMLGNLHYQKYLSVNQGLEDSLDLKTAVKWFGDGSKLFKDSTFSRNAAYLLNYWGAEIVFQLDLTRKNGKDGGTVDQQKKAAKSRFEQALRYRSYENEVTAESYNYLAFLASRYDRSMDAALSYSKKSFDLKPKDEWTYRLYASLRKNSKAELLSAYGAIKTAISIDKLNLESYDILGTILTNLDKYDSAIIIYSDLVKKQFNRKYLQPYVKVLYKLKNYDLSVKELEKFLTSKAVEKDKKWAKSELANSLQLKGESERSYELLDKLLIEDKFNSDALYILGQLADKNYDPALKRIIKIYESGESLDDLVTLVYYLEKDRQYTNALVKVDFGLKKFKDNPEALYRLNFEKSSIYFYLTQDAYAKQDQKSTEVYANQAIYFSEKALSYNANSDDAMSILMVIYNEYLFDAERSFDICARALKVNPKSSLNWTNFIDGAFNSGRYQAVLDTCAKMLSNRDADIVPLNPEELLNIAFFQIAANLALNKTFEAITVVGEFTNIYRNLPPERETEYIWNGTEKHINHDQVFSKYVSVLNNLLTLIKASKRERDKGLKMLAETRSLLKGSIAN